MRLQFNSPFLHIIENTFSSGRQLKNGVLKDAWAADPTAHKQLTSDLETAAKVPLGDVTKDLAKKAESKC